MDTSPDTIKTIMTMRRENQIYHCGSVQFICVSVSLIMNYECSEGQGTWSVVG